jgi:hypothetical protein
MKFIVLTRREDDVTFGIHVDEIRHVQMFYDRDGVEYTTIWDSDGNNMDVKERPSHIDLDLAALIASADFEAEIN